MRMLPAVLLLAALPAALPAQSGLIGKARGKLSSTAAAIRGREGDPGITSDSASGDVAIAPRVDSLVLTLQRGRIALADPLYREGTADLAPGARATVDSLAKALRALPGAFLVESHLDAVGDADSLQALSERRAVALKAALVRAGVRADRIWAAGLGATRPAPPREESTATGAAKMAAKALVPGAGMVSAARAMRGARRPENDRIELLRLR